MQYQEENTDESFVSDKVENDETVDIFSALPDIVSEKLEEGELSELKIRL